MRFTVVELSHEQLCATNTGVVDNRSVRVAWANRAADHKVPNLSS